MTKRLLLLVTVFSLSLVTIAGVGDWKIFRAYNDITEIWPGGDNIYVLSSNSLFTYNTTDASIDTYSKLSGLNENTISHIAWCQPAHKLIIAYENSNIDILSENGEVDNIIDLYNKSMTADKTINSIMVNGKYAYLSCGFGIIKLNVSDAIIIDTYTLDINVEWSYIEDGFFYASSKKDGLYRCSLNSNLLDKSNWKRVGEYKKPTTDYTTVFDSRNNCYWTKDESNALTAYKLSPDGEKTFTVTGIKPDGPEYNEFYRVMLSNGKILGIRGLYKSLIETKRKGGVMQYNIDEDHWRKFDTSYATEKKYNYIDDDCITIDPRDPNHIMTSGKTGLYEYNNGVLTRIYNSEDKESGIETNVEGKPEYSIVNGLSYDNNGNLWVLNRWNASILCLTANGEWEKHSHSIMKGCYGDLENIFFDSRGLMWFVNSNEVEPSALYCYDTDSDKLKSITSVINQDNTKYEGVYIKYVTEDKDGNIWIATNQGPFYLTPAMVSNIIASDKPENVVFEQYKVPRNDGSGYADYLLTGVDMKYIYIDDANRKWFATSGNGVYVISDDCNTEEYHFTTSNSYITDNNVHCIVMNGKTGEVYFGTDYGLCSYMSDVTDTPEEMDTETIYAYPNPVQPDYTGNITVVGLTRNAHITITTSNGIKVAEGLSKGGSFQWNGCDASGKRVASGIYNVMTSTADGSKGTVCKIAIIR